MCMEKPTMDRARVRLTPCPICGAGTWQDFLSSSTGRMMTGDQRVLQGRIAKVICTGCGTVANARPFTERECREFYQDDYELNTSEGHQHLFFSKDGAIARHQLIAERIRPHLPTNFQSILEIGCGKGELLERFTAAYPDVVLRGIDGSSQAVALAKARGFDVDLGFVVADTSLPKADVVMAIGVLEHLEDPAPFLRILRDALNPDGRVVLTVPIQDHSSCDLFFDEHVWHFHSEHLIHLLRANGLRIVAMDCSHPIDTVMGLFVCEREDAVLRPAWDKDRDYAKFVTQNRDAWLRVFGNVDRWLNQIGTSKLAVFGAGEVFALFRANSQLGKAPIAVILDEDPQKIGGHLAGVSVHDPRWLATQDDIAVMLAINPRYHEPIRLRLTPQTKTIFTWNVMAGSDHRVAAPSACALA